MNKHDASLSSSTQTSISPTDKQVHAQAAFPSGASIILFDGVCNLCNSAVQFIIRRDPQGRFKFAAQQSDAGIEIMRQFHIHAGEAGTIILIEGDKYFTQSTAALRIARHLRGFWLLLYAGIIVPPFLRNAVYAFIARNRYRWFGRREQCMLPSPEMKKRFLN